MTWVRRIGLSVIAALLLLVLVAGAAVFAAVRASIPDYGGELRVEGLSAPVRVYRDSAGVPQVYAETAEDLFRAQGYLHATDRFWEMDFRRHVTAGRLAEMFGSAQVPTDAYIRTMGWRRVAESEYDLLAPDTRRWLDAYADGVNAWLADHSGVSASLEYGVLALRNREYRIERWTPVDSLAWLKAMAWDLRSNLEPEIARGRLLASGLDRARVEELYPPYPADRHAPIVTGGGVDQGVFDPAASERAVPSPARRPLAATDSPDGPDPAERIDRADGTGGEAADVAGLLARVGAALDALPELLGPAGHGLGSNGWVVAGSRTVGGRPLLANDPHLGAAMPSIWYQVGLHCTTVGPECPFDVVGYSFSGLPGVVIGHNARIAWGFTNLGPDVADLYLERISGDGYERDGAQVPLQVRRERIDVAGSDPVTITIRETVHGPLLSDRDSDLRVIGANAPYDRAGAPAATAQPTAPRYGVALRWTALDPGRTADALFALNRASNWSEFRAAARLFAVPAQNMVYADVDGHIGYQAPGDIPVRTAGDGRYPVPGWSSRFDWSGRIPFDALPYAFDPPSGYVATANQQVVGAGYPYLLTADWDYGYRSQRIADLLTSPSASLDVAALGRIQADTRNGNAPVLVPALLRIPVDGVTADARDLLLGWDFTQPEGSAAAAFFNAVWRHLLLRTFDELSGDLRPDGGARWFEVMRGLLPDPTSRWWDEDGTNPVETRDDMLRTAMDDATAELSRRLGPDPEDWRWGDLHTLTLENATFGRSGIGPVEWLFNRGPVAVSGGDGIVEATGWNPPVGYQVDALPSMRMVVDLGDLDRSRWVNVTGTSGHAFSRHYTDQLELWRTGGTTPMRWRPDAIRRESRYVQRLLP